VYRRIDPGVDATRNTETFSAVESALARGEAICLFPEGISHDHGKLETLRTGASRMALSSTFQGHAVQIVPVGLNFDRAPAFRSRVTTVFGKTIEFDDILADYQNDETQAVRDLTERISHRLRQLMVEANPRDDLTRVARIERLYASARGVSRNPKDQIIRRQLIAEGMEALRERDPNQLHEILAQVHSYDASLDRFRLRDRDIERRITAGLAWRFVIREGLLGLVLAPLAGLSLVIFALPYWLTGRFGRRAPDLQSRATWKVAGGVIAYGLWIGLLATAIGVGRGWQVGLGAAAALTALAFLGLAAFEREASVFRTVKAFLALRQTPLKARAALKRQRVELASVLERVGEWVRD
jgi:glycerol-3-phosphate O-acyltransferase/dihydroxyacetone phosphate acyltransferase